MSEAGSAAPGSPKQRPLAGRNRWVSALSTLAAIVGIFLAMIYVWVAVELPPGTRLSLLLVLVVVGGSFNFLGDSVEQRRLGPLRMLGDGTLAPTRANLIAAARGVAGLPELTFWLALGFLGLGALATAVVWPLLVEVPSGVVWRVSFIGVAVAPITATLSLVVTLPRSRVVLKEIAAAGLGVRELHEALAPAFVMRRRLVAFSVLSTASPVMFVIDLALARMRDTLEAVSEATDGAGIAAAATAQQATGQWGLVALVVLVLGMVAVAAWMTGTILGQPLHELAAETERLMKGAHGDPRFIAAEYESLAAAGALAGIEGELLGLLRPLGDAARSLSATTGQLQKLGPRRSQRTALTAAHGTTLELARSAREVAQNAQSVSEFAQQTLTAAKKGRESSQGFLRAMADMRRGNQAIADSVVRLNKRVQQVGRIVEFIEGIADRSDLLALNAELEGHKAGEIGRGFSLVAAEMRRLAESVMVSTREISRLIEEIRDATNAAVMATEAGVKATDVGASLAHRVGDGLSKIVDFANQSADAMQSISLATAQQQLGTDQLVAAMAEILKSAEVSAAAQVGMQAAHDQLTSLAADLEKGITNFEVQA
ncbi:MAG: methyl-accepting chemotaxis protein [Myxococcaceae bacterium]